MADIDAVQPAPCGSVFATLNDEYEDARTDPYCPVDAPACAPRGVSAQGVPRARRAAPAPPSAAAAEAKSATALAFIPGKQGSAADAPRSVSVGIRGAGAADVSSAREPAIAAEPQVAPRQSGEASGAVATPSRVEDPDTQIHKEAAAAIAQYDVEKGERVQYVCSRYCIID